MTGVNVEKIFQEAACQLRRMKLIDNKGNIRILEPYMIYAAPTGKKCFHFYQIDGYSESRQYSGWKNPETNTFLQAEILEETFVPRKDYNPFNLKRFSRVFFSIPTVDGRQRSP